MSDINEVRERLERAAETLERGWRIGGNGEGGDIRALLADHALLQKHGEEYREKIRDMYREQYAREELIDRLEASRPQPAPAIDLEQFREAVCWMFNYARTDAEMSHARRLLALIDGQATPRPLIARQLAEWHEDDGPAMWWAWCGSDWAGEPAWCGTPNDCDWPGYHTHWTPHPAMPMQPTKGEGE